MVGLSPVSYICQPIKNIILDSNYILKNLVNVA
jgi:hypothetical protein